MPTAEIKVRVHELALLADIGINPEEIGKRQPLTVSVELALSSSAAAAIEETVDYRRIVSAAEHLAGVEVTVRAAPRLADNHQPDRSRLGPPSPSLSLTTRVRRRSGAGA